MGVDWGAIEKKISAAVRSSPSVAKVIAKNQMIGSGKFSKFEIYASELRKIMMSYASKGGAPGVLAEGIASLHADMSSFDEVQYDKVSDAYTAICILRFNNKVKKKSGYPKKYPSGAYDMVSLYNDGWERKSSWKYNFVWQEYNGGRYDRRSQFVYSYVRKRDRKRSKSNGNGSGKKYLYTYIRRSNDPIKFIESAIDAFNASHDNVFATRIG